MRKEGPQVSIADKTQEALPSAGPRNNARYPGGQRPIGTIPLKPLIMRSKFQVNITVHLRSGYTPEQANFVPGTFDRVFEKEVLATLESEAEELAFEQLQQEITLPGSDPQACSFTCKTVRLTPLQPVDAEIMDSLRQKYGPLPLIPELGAPAEAVCRLCDGLGCVADQHHGFILCRCPECSRFKTEEEMFRFIYAKLRPTPSAQESIFYFTYCFEANQRFDTAVQAIFRQLKTLQEKFPNAKRGFTLTIEGHRNAGGGFDEDAYELQVNFVINFLMNYLSHAIMPIGNINNENQRNDIPGTINILPPKN